MGIGSTVEFPFVSYFGSVFQFACPPLSLHAKHLKQSSHRRSAEIFVDWDSGCINRTPPHIDSTRIFNIPRVSDLRLHAPCACARAQASTRYPAPILLRHRDAPCPACLHARRVIETYFGGFLSQCEFSN